MDSLDSKIGAGSFFALFVLLLASYCVWVLRLPLFPSLDGPLHLYYASVLGSLLSGSKTYASYYFIRHTVPPYALHYYFLIAVAHFVGYAMADKLMVCLIFVTTAFGFRYLACQLGPSGSLLSLFSVPLLLNWSLGMGFYNYCLAIGIALWALGLWYRAVARRSQPLWIGFMAVVVLLVLTHPVPTLFVYILVGLDVAWRMQQCWRNHQISQNTGAHFLRGFGWDVFYMLLAWCTVAYIAHFTGGSRVMANVLQTYNRKAVLLKLAKLSTLSMFSGMQLTTIAYRISLYILLILAIMLASRGCKARWRNRIATPSDILLGCSLLLLIVIPILPPVMNGANYFSQRLVILVWIGTLAAASGYARLSPPVRLAIAGSACIYAMAVLTLANMRVQSVAAQIARIETAPVSNQQLTGLALGLPNGPSATDLDYVPYYWAAARYFRRSHSTLLNGGWLYESYVALGSKVGSISDQLTPYMQDSPGDVYHLLLRSKTAQAQIMPHTNLVVFIGYATPNTLQTTLRTMDQAEPSRRWSCQPAGWYSICTAPFLSGASKD